MINQSSAEVKEWVRGTNKEIPVALPSLSKETTWYSSWLWPNIWSRMTCAYLLMIRSYWLLQWDQHDPEPKIYKIQLTKLLDVSRWPLTLSLNHPILIVSNLTGWNVRENVDMFLCSLRLAQFVWEPLELINGVNGVKGQPKVLNVAEVRVEDEQAESRRWRDGEESTPFEQCDLTRVPHVFHKGVTDGRVHPVQVESWVTLLDFWWGVHVHNVGLVVPSERNDGRVGESSPKAPSDVGNMASILSRTVQIYSVVNVVTRQENVLGILRSANTGEQKLYNSHPWFIKCVNDLPSDPPQPF